MAWDIAVTAVIPENGTPSPQTLADRGVMGLKTPLRLTLIRGFALYEGRQQRGMATSAQRLIALLAVRDRPVGRLHVAGILWPDYPTERSLADLRTALWRVNQSSERVIAATPSFLRLGTDIEVDVRNLVVFARRLNQAATAPEAIDLDSVGLNELGGDLLPDWYDDWLQDEREELRQIQLHALENLARRLSASGRHGDAIQAALTAIRLEPLRENRPPHSHRDAPGRGQLVGGLPPIPAVPAIAHERARCRALRFDAPAVERTPARQARRVPRARGSTAPSARCRSDRNPLSISSTIGTTCRSSVEGGSSQAPPGLMGRCVQGVQTDAVALLVVVHGEGLGLLVRQMHVLGGYPGGEQVPARYSVVA